jgi:HK97 family phage major capsid protein
MPLANRGNRYTFGAGVSQLKIPVRTTTSLLSGAWVGEGSPKPVKKASFSSVPLIPYKLAVISTFTEEMALYSNPAIEAIIRQGLQDDTSVSLDTYLIDAVASSASRPAGLLNGVGALTATASGTSTEKMVADIKQLLAAIVAAGGGNDVVMLINPAQAITLGFAQTTTGDFLFATVQEAGQKFNVSFLVSQTVAAGRIIAIDASEFATATGDSPRFAISNEATLHEEDTTPLALGATGSPNVVAAPMRSLFQTDSVAIRLTLYVTWVMRRTGMVQTIASVGW